MPGAIVVFSKSPDRGPVKTRLAARLGDAGARALYTAFLHDTLRRAVRVAARVQADVFWAHADPAPPSGPRPAWLPPGVRLFPQRGVDLGARMAHAIDDAGGRRVVLIGGDSPTLPDARLEAAFAGCDDGEVVVGPVEDGGYHLIGLPAPQPELFRDVAWSTDRVFDQTRARARAHGIPLRILPVAYDVDRPEDLDRLAADPELAAAPATREALSARARRRAGEG